MRGPVSTRGPVQRGPVVSGPVPSGPVENVILVLLSKSLVFLLFLFSFVVLSISYRLQQKYNNFFYYFVFLRSLFFLFSDYSIAYTLQQKYNT